MPSGSYASGTFHSEPDPAFAKVPNEVQIQIPLFANVPVNLVGARLQVTYATPNLVQGRINGAVRKVELDTHVIPALAAQLSLLAPFSSEIQSLFDNGGAPDPACGNQTCRNANGSCAKSGDLVIDPCEVGTNAIIKNVLAPDVQLFDAAGNYAPNPLNTARDSLSVGIAFSAVPASF